MKHYKHITIVKSLKFSKQYIVAKTGLLICGYTIFVFNNTNHMVNIVSYRHSRYIVDILITKEKIKEIIDDKLNLIDKYFLLYKYIIMPYHKLWYNINNGKENGTSNNIHR